MARMFREGFIGRSVSVAIPGVRRSGREYWVERTDNGAYVNVPDECVPQLKAMGFIGAGESTQEMVEYAAGEALRRNREEQRYSLRSE